MANLPTSSGLRKLSGSNLDRVNQHEARFAKLSSLPDVRGLNERARVHYNEIGPELLANGLLHRGNVMLLAMLCRAYAEWEEAAADVDARGQRIKVDVFNRSGELAGTKEIPNPAEVQMRQNAELATKIAVHFGLTRAAATRIVASPRNDKPAKKSLREFISQPVQEGERPN